MPQTLLKRLRDAFDWAPADVPVDEPSNRESTDDGTGDSDEPQDTEEDDDTWFVPSLLDYSVREAHGGGSAEAAREIERIQQEADALESMRENR